MSMVNNIINPETGRSIKQGSKTHISLIAKGASNRKTLEKNKISIFMDSRQKMAEVEV